MRYESQKMLDELMDTFDFNRVARVMQLLEWRWASVEDFGIPDERHIRATVREYIRQAINQATTNTGHAPGRGFIGTGGFHIEAHTEGGVLKLLWVRFDLTETVVEPLESEAKKG